MAEAAEDWFADAADAARNSPEAIRARQNAVEAERVAANRGLKRAEEERRRKAASNPAAAKAAAASFAAAAKTGPIVMPSPGSYRSGGAVPSTRPSQRTTNVELGPNREWVLVDGVRYARDTAADRGNIGSAVDTIIDTIKESTDPRAVAGQWITQITKEIGQAVRDLEGEQQ